MNLSALAPTSIPLVRLVKDADDGPRRQPAGDDAFLLIAAGKGDHRRLKTGMTNAILLATSRGGAARAGGEEEKEPGPKTQRIVDCGSQVLAHAAASENLIRSAIFRNEGDAPGFRRFRRSFLERLAANLNDAFGRRDAEDGLGDFRSAGAHQSAQTKDLASAKIEGDATQQPAVRNVAHAP